MAKQHFLARLLGLPADKDPYSPYTKDGTHPAISRASQTNTSSSLPLTGGRRKQQHRRQKKAKSLLDSVRSQRQEQANTQASVSKGFINKPMTTPTRRALRQNQPQVSTQELSDDLLADMMKPFKSLFGDSLMDEIKGNMNTQRKK